MWLKVQSNQVFSQSALLPQMKWLSWLSHTERETVIQLYSGLLGGHVLFNVTNRVNFQSVEPFHPNSSAAEQIKRLVSPSMRPVIVFNTSLASVLPSEKGSALSQDVFIAGENAESK